MNQRDEKGKDYRVYIRFLGNSAEFKPPIWVKEKKLGGSEMVNEFSVLQFYGESRIRIWIIWKLSIFYEVYTPH